MELNLLYLQLNQRLSSPVVQTLCFGRLTFPCQQPEDDDVGLTSPTDESSACCLFSCLPFRDIWSDVVFRAITSTIKPMHRVTERIIIRVCVSALSDLRVCRQLHSSSVETVRAVLRILYHTAINNISVSGRSLGPSVKRRRRRRRQTTETHPPALSRTMCGASQQDSLCQSRSCLLFSPVVLKVESGDPRGSLRGILCFHYP